MLDLPRFDLISWEKGDADDTSTLFIRFPLT